MKFIFWCVFEHLDFRIPEFEALSELFNVELNWIDKNQTHPWVILDLSSESEAKLLCSRSISTKFCAHLWTYSDKSIDDFHEKVQEYCDKHALKFDEETSFKIQVEAFCRKLSMKEKVAKIECFDYLEKTVLGPIKLDNPDVTFMAFEFYGFDHNNIPVDPLHLFFGQFVAEGQRDLIGK